MSAVVQFKALSSSMIDLLDTFDGLCDKVLIEHNDKARDLTKLCYNLHKEFYEQMRNVSLVCNDSSTSIRNILLELTVAARSQKFDSDSSTEIQKSIRNLTTIIENHKAQSGETNSKILSTQESVSRAQTHLNKDRPNTKLLDQLSSSETMAFFRVCTRC